MPQLKPKLDNAEAKKPFYEFSFTKTAGPLVRIITGIKIVLTCEHRYKLVACKIINLTEQQSNRAVLPKRLDNSLFLRI